MLDVKSQDISIPEAVVVLCTAPDEATAQDLAAKVLAEKLAACATLLPRRDIAVLLGRQTGAGV
ncbi:Divalent cation tolerance protein [Salmonella enterica subsp. enterica]|nr:Divalent cation tolerance protein [Salmonella enterica subsp. enterica]